ncbi:MAG: phosphatidate cytidylyltransferase [Pelagimonas sp.]|jgi:phosphatidate cytidylyltransferase|nr:phosphatidate cytidylyltransferase [Pelagimonas sp.]
MSEGRWRDLGPRIASAGVLIAVAVGCFISGPQAFGALIAVFTGVMIWELVRMVGAKTPQLPVVLGVISAGCVLLPILHLKHVVPVVAIFVLVTVALTVTRARLIALGYSAAVLASGYGLVTLSKGAPGLVVLLIGVVVLTDVAGYFAGKSIGGPKFWPRVSPKKTWAGIVAGWLAGGAFALIWDFEVQMFVVGVLMSFASQMGDMAESAIKRYCGVKDSSNLIPGHGGFLDRFDGIVGATLVLLLAFWALPRVAMVGL